MKNKNEKTSSRTFTLWIKTLAYLLSILLIFYAVPANVYAELIETVETADIETAENTPDNEIISETEETDETEEINKSKKSVFEVKDRREETVKHFRTEDGSFTAVQYGIPVHEKDENGEWQDIDNTLSDTGSDYATSNARVKFAKKTTGNETLFTLHDGNRKITMSLSGANKKVSGQVTNIQTEFSEDATKLQKLMTLDKLSSKILYPDILDGVDLEYVVNSGNIKENIIVKDRADAYSFTFEVKLNNLVAELCEDGSIVITDPDTEESVYTIPKGYMYDAAGEHSDAVTYTLTSGGNGKYSLTVTADAEWIDAEGRAFPVTVDPPINATPDASYMTDTYITNTAPNTTYYPSAELKSGSCGNDEYMAFWRTSNIPSLPENAYLVKACFMMDCIRTGDPYTHTFATKIGLYNLSSSNWTSGLTWNNRSNSFVADDNDLVDFAEIKAATDTASANWVSWDITSLYTQWLSDSTSNYGLALVPIGDKKDYAVFSSANSIANIPCIIIDYRDMKGVESYWSGSTHSAGLAGSGFVNHATGDLVFSIGTLSTTDGFFGHTPSIIYNTAITDEYYKNSYNPNVYYPSLTTGQGLKLSISESIMEGSYIDVNRVEQTYFVWSDSDGTEHYFLCDELEQTTVEDPYDRKYKDEDGLRLSLTIVENSTGYNIVITHSDGSSRVFNATLSDNKLGGVIEYLQDRYGNRLYLSAPTDTANKTVVKVLPYDETEAIEYMTFTYHSMLGQLMEIRDSVSGYVVQIEYGISAEDDAMISSTCCGPLRRIKFGHLVDSTVVVDRTVSYGYTHCTDGLYRLSWARDDDAKAEIRYEYDSLGRVIKVSEIAYTTENNEEVENLGQSVSFTYGIGYTEVRSSGEDDILQTGTDSDDIITHYTLDRYGRAISAYSTNATRIAMYGATNNAYEAPSEKDDNNVSLDPIPVYTTSKNSIKTASVVNSVSANYVYNGSFESVTFVGNDYVPLGWLLGGNVTMLEDETEPSTEPNVNGVTIKNPEIDLPSSITQYVTLPNGTYTLSAKCIAGYCENAIAEMIVDSISDSDPPYVAEIRHSDITDTITESEPVLTFEANGTSENSETFAITFQISQMADTTACEGSVTIDEVMLTQNIGAAQFNMIQNGSFDGAAYNSLNVTQNLLGNVWQYDSWDIGSTWATTESVESDFGESLAIVGDVNKYRTYGQTIIPSALDDEITNRSRTFILSGFGKGSANVANEEAYFSLDVDVIYADSTATQHFYFNFSKDTEDWQFLSATFTTKDDHPISHMVVYCTYANQVGTAYFDEISLVEASGGNAVTYDYDNEGRLIEEKTPDVSVYYQYDPDADHNEPVCIIDSYFNLTEFKYNNKGILQSEKTYKYTYTGNSEIIAQELDNFVDCEDGLVSYHANIDKEMQSMTSYSIEKHGLLLSTTYTSHEESNPLTLFSNTEYDTTAGSRTFGKPLRAVTTSGQAIRYQYNDKGLLISEFTEGQGGLYYTYDVLGRTSQVVPYIYLGSGDLYYANTISQSASYTYDEKYRLSSITTESTTYNFTYDEFGNTNQILIGNIPLVTYEYAANNGKLQKMIYGNDNFVEYSYDELDRLSEVCYTYTDSSGNLVNNSYLYTYTTTGTLHSVKSTEANREYFCVRDSEGKAIFYNENDATGGTELLKISYEYDEQNRLSDQYQMISYTAPGNLVSASYHLKVKYNTDDTLQTYSIKLGASNVANLAYTYDGLDRIKTKTVTGGTFCRTESYTYKPRGGLTTYQIGTYTSTTCGTSTTYSYTYDNNGNITHMTDGDGLVTRYIYDNLGQLTREDNPYLNKTYLYTYDNAGNRTSKKTYTYTTGSLASLTPTSTQAYTYSTGAWGDRLSGTTYDGIGNPLTYSTYALTWSGRELVEMNRNYGQSVISFLYNDEGIRTSKNVGGTVHTYILNGSQIVSETWGQRMLLYFYDESGAPMGLQYRQSSYAAGVFDTFYFEKNIFGDIVAVYTEAGVKIGTYTYDAWGNCTTTVASGNTPLQSTILRTYNPFRYRGYYYDTDTGLYYLQSRYYNPATGRFINADGYVNANGDLIGFNMYAYCSNNPIMCVDPTGKSWLDVITFFSDGLTEIQNGFASFMDGFNYFMETFSDSLVVDIGFGAGLGIGIEAADIEGEALIRSDFITFRKDAGENSLFYWGRAEEQYLSVEGLGCVIEHGGNKFIYPDGCPIEGSPVVPHFNTTASVGVKAYLVLGLTASIGFDWNYLISKLFLEN